ncbi:hypothetical protein [Hyunsoonleella ulvae]|uniref:hypothetical protein n=1 Tax=Hyunsoonleella ulvae TaxID=2799948 RepID=UPI00193932D2|nr:hypothetical protein [Hyunsoonleella ulvae]
MKVNIKLIIKISYIVILSNPILYCHGQNGSNTDKTEHFKTKRFDVMIFPYRYYEFGGKAYTPTKKDILRAERQLNKHLKTLNKALKNQDGPIIIHENLDKYKRQYFGYINEEGHRILHINSFWHTLASKEEDWNQGRRLSFHGGCLYWNIKYNVDQKKLFGLNINNKS